MTAFRLFRIVSLLTFVAATSTLVGCGDDKQTNAGDAGKLVVYSGREAELVDPLFKAFESDTGINVEVRYAGSPELAATIAEEGDNGRADVFFAQDAGSIGSVAEKGLLAGLNTDVTAAIPAEYRDGANRWTGVTGRVRVLAYNTEKIAHDDLPASVLELTDGKWKGRLGIAPGNASFQAFVTAMRETRGDAATLKWLKAIKANEPQTFDGNGAIVEAAAKGEIDAGLVNHYYLYELKSESPDAPVANHYFQNGDVGSLINVSAAGILKHAPNATNAQRFITYLLNDAQEFFATEAEEKEYPLVSGYEDKLPKDLKPLDEIDGPDVKLSEFGAKLPATVRLIESAGFSGT